MMVDLGELRFFPLRWGRTISGAVFCIQNDETKMPSEKKNNNGPVVCNDAETQVTQEGSDENTANYSIKCAFVMSS